MALEDLSLDRRQPNDRPWDQFEANQLQYGIQTTFNEEVRLQHFRWHSAAHSVSCSSAEADQATAHCTGWLQMYTTKLDKSQARISEREAARIAAEIEGKRTTNIHQAEERGQISYREMARVLTAAISTSLGACARAALTQDPDAG